MRLNPVLLAVLIFAGCTDDDTEEYEITSTCSVTSLPTSGTLTAARINSRFTQLTGCINGSLGNTNLSTADKIAITKIANDESYVAITESLPCASSIASVFTFRVPAAATLTAAFVRCRGCSASDIDVDLQVGGVTQISFAGIANTTTNASTGHSIGVAVATDVEWDVTANTVGSCAALDATAWLKLQHIP